MTSTLTTMLKIARDINNRSIVSAFDKITDLETGEPNSTTKRDLAQWDENCIIEKRAQGTSGLMVSTGEMVLLTRRVDRYYGSVVVGKWVVQ